MWESNVTSCSKKKNLGIRFIELAERVCEKEIEEEDIESSSKNIYSHKNLGNFTIFNLYIYFINLWFTLNLYPKYDQLE